jgi:hypothetical protein
MEGRALPAHGAANEGMGQRAAESSDIPIVQDYAAGHAPRALGTTDRWHAAHDLPATIETGHE